MDKMSGYGVGGKTTSDGYVLFRLELLMSFVAPSGFMLNAKCCGAHPSFENIYPARYRFFMMTMNYEKAMINMLRTKPRRAPKPRSLLDFLLHVNDKPEIPAVLKVSAETIATVVGCAGFGESLAPSALSSSLMTIFYMAYLDQHYGVKCDEIVRNQAARRNDSRHGSRRRRLGGNNGQG